MKGVMKFGHKENLGLWYIGPYKISKRIDSVDNELELPQELTTVHLVCHIFILMNSMADPSLSIPTEDNCIKDCMSYQEIPVKI